MTMDDPASERELNKMADNPPDPNCKLCNGEGYCLEGGGDGIHLELVTNFQIRDIIITDCQNNGIYAVRPHFAHISEFKIHWCKWGINF